MTMDRKFEPTGNPEIHDYGPRVALSTVEDKGLDLIFISCPVCKWRMRFLSASTELTKAYIAITTCGKCGQELKVRCVRNVKVAASMICGKRVEEGK